MNYFKLKEKKQFDPNSEATLSVDVDIEKQKIWRREIHNNFLFFIKKLLKNKILIIK